MQSAVDQTKLDEMGKTLGGLFPCLKLIYISFCQIGLGEKINVTNQNSNLSSSVRKLDK